MKSVSTRGFATALVWISGTAMSALVIGAAALTGAPTTAPTLEAPAPAMAAAADGRARLNPTLIYNGNAACMGSGCHDADKPKNHSGQMIGDECNIWKDSDPHAKAFKSLSNKKSKDIAGKMKIDDAATDARCISCHGMPAAKLGDSFGKGPGANGVGCESCHGPSEKWLDAHKEEGWTDKQRAAMSAKDIETKFGLIDTRNLAVRGEMCVTCHLQIDQDMLDAGHPALGFEMYFYNNYKFNPDWKTHWDEQPGDTHKAKEWAIGQIVSAAAADAQVVAWKAKGWKTDVADQLSKVFGEGKAIASTLGPADAAGFYAEYKGKDIDKAKVAAAAKALASKGAGYKDGKDNAHVRSVISSGVEALVSSTLSGGKMTKDVEDKAITAGDAADAGGDSWVKAVTDLAAAAK